MNRFRNFAYSFSWADLSLGKILLAFTLKAGSAVVAFAFSLFIARRFSYEESGYFFLGLAIATVASTICRLGLDQTVTRIVAGDMEYQDWGNIKLLYRKSMLMCLLFSLGITILITLTSNKISETFFGLKFAGFLVAFAAAVPAITISCLHSRFFQGVRNVIGLQLYQNTLPSIFAMAILLSMTTVGSQTITAINMAWILTMCFWCTALFAALHWNFTLAQHINSKSHQERLCQNKPQQCAIDKTGKLTLTSLLTTSSSLWLISILAIADKWFGQIVIGIYCDPSEVAFFTIALRAALLVTLVLEAVNSNSFPTFAALYRQNKLTKLKASAIQSSWLGLGMGLPVTLIIFAFAEQFMTFFGAQYAAGANILRCIAIGQLINVSTGSVGGLLIATGNQNAMLKNTVISAGMFVGLSILLVPLWGGMGAAIASSVSCFTQMILSVWSVRKRVGFWPIGTVGNPMAVASVRPEI